MSPNAPDEAGLDDAALEEVALDESARSSRQPASAASTADRRTLWLLLLAAVVACAAFMASEVYVLDGGLGFPLDDSFIHLTFARHLAAGDGLSYGTGELVTGSTAPLWTALLAVLTLLPGSTIVWSKILGVICHLASVAVTWSLGRELGMSRGATALATGLMLSTSWLVWSALSGMEISLFIALSLTGILLHVRERSDRSSLKKPALSLGVIGLSVLARPEGLLLLILALFERCLLLPSQAIDAPEATSEAATIDGESEAGAWRFLTTLDRSHLARGFLLAVVALVPVVLLYWWIGGSPLPTTFQVKAGADSGRSLLPDPRYLYTVLGIVFRPLPWATMAVGAGVLALVRRLGGPLDRGLLPALWLIGLPLAYAVINPAGRTVVGNFGRYHFPLLPLVALLGVLGLSAASATVARLVPGRLGRLLLPLAVVLILWPTVSELARGAGRYAQNVRNVEDGDVTMAAWLAERLPTEATLATVDIGALGYGLPNRLYDLAGIVDPEVHEAIAEARKVSRPWHDGVLAFIAREQPDYVVVFPNWLPHLGRAGSGFEAVHSIEIANNITLGGDRLVLYRTPWTRYPLASSRSAP